MTSTATAKMARAITLGADGPNVRAILADNAASARAARAFRAQVAEIEAEYEASVSWGLMTLSRRGDPSDYCVVAGHVTDAGELTVAARAISGGNPLPIAAFETAARNRATRNRDARLAAAAQEAGK